MSRNGDTDRVFSEDPATIRIKQDEELLMSRLRDLVDPEFSTVLMPAKAPLDWPPEAVNLHAQYEEVSKELSRLSSRRMSQQVSWFLSENRECGEISDAGQRWWWDRY